MLATEIAQCREDWFYWCTEPPKEEDKIVFEKLHYVVCCAISVSHYVNVVLLRCI